LVAFFLVAFLRVAFRFAMREVSLDR